jgi:uncharacterized cupin superfamily protein
VHDETPVARRAFELEPEKRTGYPAPFAARVAGRERRRLGNGFGLKNFGVNLTRLAPGSASALLHRHGVQDEFVYVLEGRAVLRTDTGEVELSAGMCAGFPAGGPAHQLVNRGSADVLYLEIGDRLPGDSVEYPEDDLAAHQDAEGRWKFTHKDGRAY